MADEKDTLDLDFETETGSDDDWDDIDLTDVEAEEDDTDENTGDPDDGEEADQQTAEDGDDTTEAPAGEKQQETGQDKADQLFTLKHLGETRQVNRDEAVILAQKGLDYDHIRTERDTARADVKRLSAFEDFLKELAAPSNQSLDELMDTTRARLLVESERKAGRKMDPATALDRIKLDRDRKALELEKTQAQQAQTEKTQQDQAADKRKEDFLDFAREHPDIEVKSIPKEVWDRVTAGESLTNAYAKYENKQLRERLKTLEQNAKNKDRSTGSRASAGKQTAKDPWLAGWDDG